MKNYNGFVCLIFFIFALTLPISSAFPASSECSEITARVDYKNRPFKVLYNLKDKARGRYVNASTQLFAREADITFIAKQHGVVAWVAEVADSKICVNYTAYNPISGSWSNTDEPQACFGNIDNSISIEDFKTEDGVVTWMIRDDFSAFAEYELFFSIYDSEKADWTGKRVDTFAEIPTNLSINSGTISYKEGENIIEWGYRSGSWDFMKKTKPLAGFFAGPKTIGEPPLEVCFMDSSIGGTSWEWDFGDAETSQERCPCHTFSSTDSFTVTQTVDGPGGGPATFEEEITTATKADLVVVDIKTDPIEPQIGKPVDVWLEIKNKGVKRAENFRIDWYAGDVFWNPPSPGIPGDIAVVYPSLLAGSSTRLHTKYTYSSYIGNYNMYVQVDRTDEVSEDNELNNLSDPYPITITHIDWGQTLKVTTGWSHTVVLKTDGTLWAFGENSRGKLGDGTTTGRSYPVQIGTDQDWAQVTAGQDHTVALKADGSLWAWGANDHGQLGDGTTIDRHSPVQIGMDQGWAEVSAGGGYTVALKANGTLWAWGVGGKLGDGTHTSRTSPVKIGTDGNWTQLAAGTHHAIALKVDGTLWAWGDNSYGQLGDGRTTISRTYPMQIGTEQDWNQVSAGFFYTVALKADGTLWAWGWNKYGQLGDGTTVDRYIPVQIGTDRDWSQVDAGPFSHTLALKADNTRWAWGSNFRGQLGDGATTDRYYPVQTGTGQNWIQVTAGESRSVALKSDGTLWAWGDNSWGKLGDGTLSNRHSPVEIGNMNMAKDWIRLAGGGGHTVGLMADGTIWTWGSNNYGEVGDGTTIDRHFPMQIGVDQEWVRVTGGKEHTAGLMADGSLWAWGWNTHGQLGDSTTIDRSSPVQIGTDQDWTQVSGGAWYTVALKNDGTVWTWGWNRYGQLGDGTMTDRPSPVQIGSDQDWVQVAAGNDHTLGLKTNGTLWAWGWNRYGQLGDSHGDRNYPVIVGTLGTEQQWIQAAAGNNHTIALKADGTLWAWGWNLKGQVGNGKTNFAQHRPELIGTGRDWTQVAAGNEHSLALKANGSLWAWGSNEFGQLGDGTTIDRHSPAMVGTDQDWIHVVAGNEHSIARKADGTLWAWGLNSYGQLADSTTTNRNSPVRVITPAGGDINGDNCIAKDDLGLILVYIREGYPYNLLYDLNNDGFINIADARKLVTLFNNVRGESCVTSLSE